MKFRQSEGNDQFEDLYLLVHHFTTGDQVKSLLRKHKTDLPKEAQADVRLSAETTKKLCQENLRKAVDANHIPISEVYDLLRDSEESGAQHIFLYVPKNNAALKTLSEPDRIAEQLLGKKWETHVPQTALVPNDFAWSDFRRVGKSGWIAKSYFHSVVEEKTDTIQEQDVRWEKFEKFNRRSICMAVWSADLSLLQIRIGNELDVPVVLSTFLDKLKKKGLDFVAITKPSDLSSARAKLLAEAETNTENYDYGAFRSIDREGYRFEGSPVAQDPEEPTQATQSTKKLIRQIAQNPDMDKYSLVVHWKASPDALKSNLRTLVGTKNYPNEVVINARTTPQAIHYVLEKLITFSR
jgi:hypothetical protein